MNILCKTGTVCIRVADPNLIFDRIYVCKIRIQICCPIPADLSLALKQGLSLFTIPILPHILCGGEIYSNSTSRSTIDAAKQWFIVTNVIIARVKNCPPPPLCTPYHEPIVCVIYNLFSQIIV